MMAPEPRSLQLTVGHVHDLTPRMREISLVVPAPTQFAYLPGQDVSLGFTARDGTAVRRRYSIRRFSSERGLLDINVVMHGDGPGMRWAQNVTEGMPIEAIAPRGKITLAAGTAWHLFAGDATAVPAAFGMMEALPEGTTAFGFFLVDDASERQSLQAAGNRRTVQWRYQSVEADPSTALAAAIRDTSLPATAGQAYLAGEVGLVSALKAALLVQGWTGDRIAAKAYWNRGRANAGHGEPEQKAS